MQNVCMTCLKNDVTKRCSVCKFAYYCSAECSEKDWPNHKLECIKHGDTVLDFLEQGGLAQGMLALTGGLETSDEWLLAPVYSEVIATLSHAFTARCAFDSVVLELGARFPGIAWCIDVEFVASTKDGCSLRVRPLAELAFPRMQLVLDIVEKMASRGLVPIILRKDGYAQRPIKARPLGAAVFIVGIQARSPFSDVPVLPACNDITRGLILITYKTEGTDGFAICAHCQHSMEQLFGTGALLGVPMPNPCHQVTCIKIV